MLRQQPHLIGINGEDLEALRLAEDTKRLIRRMNQESDLRWEIPVEIADASVAKVYMNSRISMVPIICVKQFMLILIFSKNFPIIHFY